jgi:hypothetical protein
MWWLVGIQAMVGKYLSAPFEVSDRWRLKRLLQEVYYLQVPFLLKMALFFVCFCKMGTYLQENPKCLQKINKL